MRDLLDIKLFSQSFKTILDADQQSLQARLIAEMYSKIENGISVLSDLKARKSYLYYGAVAENLGLSAEAQEINSIWEDQLLQKIQAEDCRKSIAWNFNSFSF